MSAAVDQALVIVVRLLGHPLPLSEVPGAIAETAARLPGVDGAAVLRLDAGVVVLEAACGLKAAPETRVPAKHAGTVRAVSAGALTSLAEDLPNGAFVFEPAGGGRFTAALTVPVADSEPSRAITLYRTAAGPFPDGTATVAGVLAEAAGGALRSAVLFEREGRMRRELEAINEAALVMSSELALDELLQLITDRALELVGARYAALGVPGPDGMLVRFITAGLTPLERTRIGLLPRGHGLLGALLRDNKITRTPHIQQDARSYGFPPQHPPMTKLLGVPVMFRGQNVGDLYLTDKLDGSDFTEEDEHTAVMLAAHAAIAIVNATSYGDTNEQLRLRLQELAGKNRELQRLSSGILAAQEDERRRIARELHDDTMQSLAALAVQARVAERRQDVDALRDGLMRVRIGLGETLQELRRMAHDLRPTALDDLGLVAALSGLVANFAERTGIAVESHLDRIEERLGPEIEVVLYRIAQESLSNVERHAGAAQVRIDLTADEHTVRLAVTDNGRGFDALQTRSSREHGLGLLGMEERALAVRGTIEIASRPGAGTTVTAAAPRPGPATHPSIAETA